MDRAEGRIRLALPTIDLLECKKFKGGYHEESIYDTDNYYPEEGDSAIDGGEIDPAIVYGDSTDDNYCREDDLDRDDNRDDNQNEYDQHEVNSPETVEDDRGDTPLIVMVDNGKCSDRTFAAAIQVIYKEIASKAILKAETAMKMPE